MKSVFSIILSFIGLQNCSAISMMTFQSDETLIANNYKIIQHGFFTFVIFINESEVKELIYVYSIDIKNKKVTCSKNKEKIYHKNVYLKNLDFKTAKDFKRIQDSTWRKKYYACFADNFWDMTNDEKIDLLNKLSEK